MTAVVTEKDKERVLKHFDTFERALLNYDHQAVKFGGEENVVREYSSLKFFINICDSINRETVTKDMANRLDKASLNALIASVYLYD